MTFMQARELSLRQGTKIVLDSVDLTVDRGEFFVIIGPTGAGKTSMLRLLDLLEMPSSGNILVGGMDTHVSPRKRLELRRRMAFVQQKPVAFNLSVFDNVACGLRWHHVISSTVKSRVNEILGTVGLSGYQRQNAKTLSGGEMQRVAIARALVTEPEILYLDEPTANLDPISTSKIEEILHIIMNEAKMTVVMSTHDMSQGQRLARRIGVLMGGKLLQVGSPRDIFTTPRNREVAEFVGVDNIWTGVVSGQDGALISITVSGRTVQAVAEQAIGGEVDVLIRPEEITLARSIDQTSARNTFGGRISRMTLVEPLMRVEIDCGFPILALITRRSAEEMGLGLGQQVYASFKATAIHITKRCQSG